MSNEKKEENLGGSFSNDEVFIMANDPRHHERKNSRMRDLSINPEKPKVQVKGWSLKTRLILFLALSISMSLLCAFFFRWVSSQTTPYMMML